jgi:hypothetical protein
MNIESAFTQEAIDMTGTALDDEEERAVRDIISQIDESAGIANAGVICFTAGRAYQADLDNQIQVSMSPGLAAEFMSYLYEKTQEG